MDAFTLVAKLTLNRSEFDQGLREVEGTLNSKDTKGSFSAWGVTVGNLAAQAFTKVFRAAVDFAKSVLTTGMNFDQMMSSVKAVGNMGEQEFEKVRQKAIDLGASTKFTAEEVGEAFYYMGLAGWDTEEMLSGIEGVLNLAAASGEDLGRVSDIVTDAITAMGLSAEDTARFVNVLAAASTNSNTTVGMMGEAFKYLATTGGVLEYSIEDVATVLGLLANNGIKAGQAGTSMRQILNTLIAPSDKAANAMEALGLSLFEVGTDKRKPLMQVVEELRQIFADADFDLGGQSMDEVQGKIDELNVWYDEQKKALEARKATKKEMDDLDEEYKKELYGIAHFNEDFLSKLSDIGGLRGISSLFALMKSTDEDVNQLVDAVNKSGEGKGTAAEMATTMLDNLKGDVEILNSATEGLKIALSDEINPQARKFVQLMTDGVTAITNIIRSGDSSLPVTDNIEDIANEERDAIHEAESTATKASGMVGYMETLIDKYGEAATKTAEWQEALNKLNEVMPGITKEIGEQAESASEMTANMQEYIEMTKQQKIEAAKRTAIEEYQKTYDEAQAALDKAQVAQSVESGFANDYLTAILSYVGNRQGVTDIDAFIEQWKTQLAGDRQSNLTLERLITPYLEENGEYNETLGALFESWEESMVSFGDNTEQINALTEIAEKAKAKLDAASTAFDSLTTAATNYASALNNSHPASTEGFGQAKGDWYVPYDDYPSLLHRGEMVLTASQARQFREGGSGVDIGALTSAIVGAVQEGLRNAQVNSYLDGRKVTDMIAKRMGDQLMLAR